ncbi:MAG: alpha/beta hydrolase [Acidimicrobiaceae bacterium]|nr:alpha/beta hydrolase [Acidimicrobiaceae bacterium]
MSFDFLTTYGAISRPSSMATNNDITSTRPHGVAMNHSRVALADGVALPVASRGMPRPDRPSIVLLHGLTDSWRSFEEIAGRLPNDVHIAVPTLRGHGDADRPLAGYRPDDLASDVAEVLDHLGVESALVAGHSLGAVIACRLAAARADLVAGLVVVGGFAAPGENAAIREVVELSRDLVDPIDRALVAEFQHGTTVQPVSEERMDVFIAESLLVPAHVWRAAADGLVDVDVFAGLHGATIPTSIVWGTDDPFTPLEEQEQLAQVLGGEIRRYSGTGHAVHWEQPERFAADVLDRWTRCIA